MSYKIVVKVWNVRRQIEDLDNQRTVLNVSSKYIYRRHVTWERKFRLFLEPEGVELGSIGEAMGRELHI